MYGGNAFSHPAEDIIGPRYPRPDELEIQEGLGFDHDNRPSFMDEYLSVAGNACGSLDEYWRVIYTHPRIIGGAISDSPRRYVVCPILLHITFLPTSWAMLNL